MTGAEPVVDLAACGVGLVLWLVVLPLLIAVACLVGRYYPPNGEVMERKQGEVVQLGHGLTLEYRPSHKRDFCPWALDSEGDDEGADWLTEARAKHLIAACAAPSTGGEALPAGVHAAPDGTLLWLSDADETPPVGYRVWIDGAEFPIRKIVADRWYEVRPVPAAPEMVPVDLALIGRRLHPGGQVVSQFNVRPGESDPGGLYVEMFLDDNVWANPVRDPSGLVAVLPEGDER